VELKYISGEQVMFLNGENVNDFIRTEEVSSMASVISAYPGVREVLLFMQRDLAKKNNVVMDGRDIGSHVLPIAGIKIFLTADTKVRARRRYEQLKEKGIEASLEEIEKEIIVRDERDMNRKTPRLNRLRVLFLLIHQ
jgi:cytidylate kinase